MIDPVEFGKAMGALIREATAPLLRRIEELEAREVIHGKDGRDGVDGKDAEPVSDAALAVAVAKHLEANPPAPGRDGLNGKDGANGSDGLHGKDGRDGSTPSAEDVAACFERRFSEFLLAGERRIYEMADKAIDRMPRAKDGRDGVDGIGWDAMSVEYDGERTVTLVFDKGEEQRAFPVVLPVVLDKGFWQDGTIAGQGDGFTFGGSYWIAQKDTDTKPEIGNPDWRLAVRKGRDGKRQP